MSVENKIRQLLQQAFVPDHLKIINESGNHRGLPGAETHFLIVLVSDQFEALSRIERQRQVHEVLREELKNSIHALSLRLATNTEWKAHGGTYQQSPPCQSKSQAK